MEAKACRIGWDSNEQMGKGHSRQRLQHKRPHLSQDTKTSDQTGVELYKGTVRNFIR
jgi:hypothetical protein